MGKKRNAKTGRYDRGSVEKPEADAIASADYVDWLGKEQEAQRHRRQDEIIQRFVDANVAEPEPPIPTPAEAVASIDEAIAAVRYAMNDTPMPPDETVPVGPFIMESTKTRPAGRRWLVPVLLAVGVVAGGLMGAAAKDRELRPTIHLLNRAMAVIGTRAQVEAQALRDANAGLQDANARLMLERGGALQMLEQDQATDRAASHDLRRADRALQYDQSVDRISDRAKTWEALRAVEKAERRLNEQP